MVITIQQEKRRQSYLVVVLVVIILAIIFILWQYFFKKPQPILEPKILAPPKIEINFEILESPVLKELLPFEEIKPIIEPYGRENPFLPY